MPKGEIVGNNGNQVGIMAIRVEEDRPMKIKRQRISNMSISMISVQGKKDAIEEV